jgi:hypothetical protein
MIDLEKLEQESLAGRWQEHRRFCLELAVRMGAPTSQKAIELAERLGHYVLNGMNVTKQTDEREQDK